MPVLLVERGNDKGLTLKVEPAKTYVVGRENDKAAFQLNDPMASRAHFQISSVNGAFRIRDMKSRNGTKLNDEKLPPEGDAEVKIGDKIQVGETIFSFLSDEKEESAGGGLIGKTIGGYRILERVGRGGMGTVYKAEQMSLNRVVALKVLSAKLLSDPLFVEKFVQEAKAAGGLTHPNIVQVIDVGSDRGIYFFSMEYLDNGSVGDVATKEGRIPWERALEMMTDAARGLIFAEKRGIVHRDIKPDNLMLTSEGAVKIGDLGLAKKAEDLGGEGGQIFGTPHFIAPEQAQGKPVDNRADIYALGATFYRVLAGKTPFSGENVKEILLKQIQQEPEPIAKLVPDMPVELGTVIGKMMKKRPDDRYRSAQGLFEDLELIRVRYHLEAHAATKSAKRTKAIAVFLALAVCGLGYAVYYLATRVILPPDAPKPPVIVTPPPPPPPPPDLEKEADYAYSQVKTKFADTTLRLKGGVAETWRGNETAWEEIAGEFQKVAEKHPNTAKGSQALEDAKGIRDELEKARTAWEKRKEALNGEWKAALDAMRADADAGRFNAAVAGQSAADRILRKENLEFLPPTASRDLLTLLGEIVEAAKAKVAPVLAGAEAEAGKIPGAAYMAAREALGSLRAGIAPAGQPKDDPFTEGLARLARRIDDTLAATRKTAEEAAADALDADREAWVDGYRAIRRWTPEDAAADAPETPFFAYRWDDALARWEALRKVLRTKPYQDKADLKIAVYKRCRRLFETIAAKVRSREIRDPDFPESVRKRANVDLDANKRDKATAEGVHVVRGQGRELLFVEFRAFTPRELFELFLKKGDNVPFSAEDHLDLACFLLEAGCGDHANLEWNVATVGTNPVPRDPVLADWFRWEYITYFDINGAGGPVALFDRYRAAKAGGASNEANEKARQEIEEKIREIQSKESYWITDYAILNLSQGGPEGPHPEKVLPSAVVEEFIQTLGVPGGKRLPPATTAPPPPANGNGGNPAPPPPPGGEDQGKREETPPPPPPK